MPARGASAGRRAPETFLSRFSWRLSIWTKTPLPRAFSLTQIEIFRGAGVIFRIRPAGLDAVQGELDHGRVFAENVAPDTDQIIEPKPLGAEIKWLVRSADGPEQVRLTVDLPQGAHLRLAEVAPGSGGRRAREGPPPRPTRKR
jgi:hypothetical protein